MDSWNVKLALEKYHEIRKSLKRWEDKKEEIDAKRFKVGGSIIAIPENPVSREKTIIRNMEVADTIEAEYQTYRYYKKIGDEFIEWVRLSPELKQYHAIIVDKYVNKAKNDYLVMRYNYSRQSIDNIIKRVVEAYVNLC